MQIIHTLLVTLFLLTTNSLYAFTVDENSSNINILQHSEIFVDETGKLTFEEIGHQHFVKNTTEALSYGFDPDKRVWVKFTLQNTTDEPLEKTVEYANTLVADLYFYDGNKVQTDGRFHIGPNRKTLTPGFKIVLRPFEERTFYLSAHSRLSTLLVELRLWNRDSFIEYDITYKMIEFSFFAAMMTLFVYNLMLWVFTRQKAYFYYILYLFGVMFFQANMLGILQLYLFSPGFTVWVEKASSIHISFLILTIVLFTQEFLETKQFRKIDAVFRFYLYTTPIVALLGYDNFLFDLNIIIYFIPLGFFVVFAGFYALYKGVKQARFYVIGWSVVIFTLIIVNLKTIGVVDITTYVPYINEVAFVLEALLFSIALAHKIKILSEEKEKSKNALIEFQQKEQERLTELVNEKTKDLTTALEEKNLLYKELNHRVKNNLQMVLSLIRLQIINSSSTATKEALSVTRDRVYSIANLYEVLYLQGENFQLDTLAYIKNIVSNIQTVCTKEVEIVYDVCCNLSVDQLIYCGLIINELITNAYKYAFKEDNGVITFSLTEQNGRYEIVIQDNGVGFGQESGASLGLTIVRTLVEKQLFGEMQTVTDHGARVVISWRSDE